MNHAVETKSSPIAPVCDFGRSFLTFRVDIRKKPLSTASRPLPLKVNNARLQIEARCRVTAAATGKTTEYLLSAACKAEQVNVPRDVWHQPNADMCIVVSDEQFMIVKSWDRNDKRVMLHPPSLGPQPERQVGRIADAFDRLPVHVKIVDGQVLPGRDDVVQATLSNRCIVGQTEYSAVDGSTIQLEYPIKVINVSEVDHFFQTDTGPIIWPDLQHGWGDAPIATLRHAFIAQSAGDWAELIVNVPTPLGDQISVNHYSRVERLENVTNRMIVLPE